MAWAQWATVVAAVGRAEELYRALSSAHNEKPTQNETFR
jgi:hypothetical protein